MATVANEGRALGVMKVAAQTEVQRFAAGYIVRLVDSRGNQPETKRCLTRERPCASRTPWSLVNGDCRVVERT